SAGGTHAQSWRLSCRAIDARALASISAAIEDAAGLELEGGEGIGRDEGNVEAEAFVRVGQLLRHARRDRGGLVLGGGRVRLELHGKGVDVLDAAEHDAELANLRGAAHGALDRRGI